MDCDPKWMSQPGMVIHTASTVIPGRLKWQARLSPWVWSQHGYQHSNTESQETKYSASPDFWNPHLPVNSRASVFVKDLKLLAKANNPSARNRSPKTCLFCLKPVLPLGGGGGLECLHRDWHSIWGSGSRNDSYPGIAPLCYDQVQDIFLTPRSFPPSPVLLSVLFYARVTSWSVSQRCLGLPRVACRSRWPHQPG